MKIDVLTLFPEMFEPVTGSSILGRAGEKGILNIQTTDIRDFSNDKHNKADDYPFGGGGGMVMMADPIFGALKSVKAEGKKIIYMSPRGKILDKEMINRLASLEELVILCGHYEGVDQRVIDYWDMEEISIGDYVLTGGELPAMVLIDSVARMLPDVLGNENSALDESVYSGLPGAPTVHEAKGILRHGGSGGASQRKPQADRAVEAEGGAAADKGEASRPV